jgi:general secretion pathway protein K
MTGIRRQRGVALLTALAVVALASIAATYMLTSQQLQIRRSGNQLMQEQAWQYALGAEDWAKTILAQDARDNDIDALNETWAVDLPPLPIEGGSLSGRLLDLQGYFNLNNLVNKEGKLDTAYLEQFQKLLQNLNLPVELAQSVADWQDEDIEAQGAMGAEDDYYAGMESPYRTPNQSITSISELRQMRGMDEESIRLLKPLVTALPDQTKLNINTAPAEVLASLGMDKNDALQLAEQLKETPVSTQDEIKNLPEITNNKIDTAQLGVQSQYFLLEVIVEMGQIKARLSSVIYRDSDGISHTIQRSQSVL